MCTGFRMYCNNICACFRKVFNISSGILYHQMCIKNSICQWTKCLDYRISKRNLWNIDVYKRQEYILIYSRNLFVLDFASTSYYNEGGRIMNCPNCGTYYTENEKICKKCHTPLSNAIYNPVSYTHLDVYKRQHSHNHRLIALALHSYA